MTRTLSLIEHISASELARYKQDSRRALRAQRQFKDRLYNASIRQSLTRIFNRSLSSAILSVMLVTALAASTQAYA